MLLSDPFPFLFPWFLWLPTIQENDYQKFLRIVFSCVQCHQEGL
jgi:hypothetical protein